MISLDFVNGLEVLRKYFTDQTKIVVIERSTIVVEHLIRITTEDNVYLQRIGWGVSFAQGEQDHCLAEFSHLDYVDT